MKLKSTALISRQRVNRYCLLIIMLAATITPLRATMDNESIHLFKRSLIPNGYQIAYGGGNSFIGLGLSYTPYGYIWQSDFFLGYTPFNTSGIEFFSTSWHNSLNFYKFFWNSHTAYTPLFLGFSINKATVVENTFSAGWYMTYFLGTRFSYPLLDKTPFEFSLYSGTNPYYWAYFTDHYAPFRTIIFIGFSCTIYL